MKRKRIENTLRVRDRCTEVWESCTQTKQKKMCDSLGTEATNLVAKTAPDAKNEAESSSQKIRKKKIIAEFLENYHARMSEELVADGTEECVRACTSTHGHVCVHTRAGG